MTHFLRGIGLTPGRQDEAGRDTGGSASGAAIPARYRNEHGGIDIEQVRRDQQAARQKVVREMIRSVGEIWRRR